MFFKECDTAVANDKRMMGTRWKLKMGPMTNSVILCVRRVAYFLIFGKKPKKAAIPLHP